MTFKEIKVTAHSGSRVNEYPTGFVLDKTVYMVMEILDRWYEGSPEPGKPYMNYFKIRAHDGKVYVLRYNGLFDSWAVLIQ